MSTISPSLAAAADRWIQAGQRRAETPIVQPETSDIPEALTCAFERIRALCDTRSDTLRAELARRPAKIECRRHAGQTAVLNEEASAKATDPHWTRPEQIKAVYRCPLCVSDSSADRRARKIELSGIPADVRHATFENFDSNRSGVKVGEEFKGYVRPEVFLAKARSFADGRFRNLIACGTPGIGKGHLAAAVAILRLDAGAHVVWTDCAALFRDYHTAYKTDSTENVIDRHSLCSLLVLDEICLRDLPADGEEILFAILDRRHKCGRQTILLGNAIAETVRKWLGGRIVDRLRSGGVEFCYGEWDSMRGHDRDAAASF